MAARHLVIGKAYAFILAIALSSICLSAEPIQAARSAIKDPTCGNNILEDTDSDGTPDYAYVDDWDCDGNLEMEDDIQAAIGALSDNDGRVLQIGPGDYLAPPTVVRPAAIIELPSRITVEGSGEGVTILHGFSSSNLVSQEAVISNNSHGLGNSDITIRHLDIDGGWGSGDASGFDHYRMGVYFNRCSNCRVEHVTVHDTLHSCLYSKNGSNIYFDDNTLYRCGNYSGIGSTYSCVYLYAGINLTQEHVHVTNNSCDRSGASALNTRRGSTTSTLSDIVFSGNNVTNTRVEGEPANCINVRGVSSASYVNNTCVNTGPLNISGGGAFYSEGTDVNAATDILVDGLWMQDVGLGASGIRILGHLEDATLRDIHVTNTDAAHDCLIYANPLKNLLFEEMELVNCGRWGMAENGDLGSGASIDEGLVMRDITVQGSASSGLRFSGPTRHLELSNVLIENSGADGIFWASQLEKSTISGVTVINPTGSGLWISAGSADVGLSGLDVSGASQHGVHLVGESGSGADHTAVTIANSTFSNIAKAGIMASQSITTLKNVTLSGNHIDGTGRTAIDLTLSPTETSNMITITGNDIRDFGREATAGADCRGIDLTGQVNGADISDNIIEDVDNQAQYGIVHNVSPTPEYLGYLCSNECTGTLGIQDCLWVGGAVQGYQNDLDSDAMVDECDGCPADGDNDADNDAICGDVDNCPAVTNPDQEDSDSDGLGRLCDNCPATFNQDQQDADSDDAGDACDNCMFTRNPSQSDADTDHEGDICDIDDGIVYILLSQAEHVEWQAEAAYDGWNLYRGDLDVLRDSSLYTQEPQSNGLAEHWCNLSSVWLVDQDSPPDGKIAFYLVTGIDGGGVEGDLGSDSAGSGRPNDNPCP